MTDPVVTEPVVTETVRRRPVLGLRFRDDATGEVATGLQVRLTVPGLAHPVAAVRSPSGVYSWWSLPGCAAWALGDDSPVPGRSAEVSVADPQRRYLACTFRVTVPLGDIAVLVCGSPVEATPPESRTTRSIPLFSLPERPTPTGMAVVRTALRHSADGPPAAYAMVQVTAETGETARGVADERGQVAVFLPYPKVGRAIGSGLLGSSPFGPRQPLRSMTWELSVGASVPRGSVTPVPDLCALLDQKPAGLSTIATAGHPSRTFDAATLEYGSDLVLPPSEPRRELLVAP